MGEIKGSGLFGAKSGDEFVGEPCDDGDDDEVSEGDDGDREDFDEHGDDDDINKKLLASWWDFFVCSIRLISGLYEFSRGSKLLLG